MRIELRKFGEILTSRPAGREAYLVMKSYLKPKTPEEPIELDFSGVKVMGPSWADEVIGAIRREYGHRIICLPSENLSVVESLKILEMSH